ncbi:MAG: hypothetical protein MR407_00110 [Roseburia sp.]|nr:hypothetical protein [Roseburia sp.]
MQTTRHAFGKILRCRACTKHRENFIEYVTTVTTMSAEGTKSACHVVWATLEYVTTVTTMSVEGAKSACLVVWATPSPCRQKGESG